MLKYRGLIIIIIWGPMSIQSGQWGNAVKLKSSSSKRKKPLSFKYMETG